MRVAKRQRKTGTNSGDNRIGKNLEKRRAGVCRTSGDGGCQRRKEKDKEGAGKPKTLNLLEDELEGDPTLKNSASS